MHARCLFRHSQTEAEQTLIVANRELVERFAKKTSVAIARVWGERNTV